MSIIPTAADIATWPLPNYVNPETRRPLVLGVEIPLMTLVVVFTSMRFYTRTVVIHALGADDWFMLAATIISFGTSIMTCISTLPAYQTGYHLWDLRPEIAANPIKTAQMAMATQLLFVPITAFTKVSILLTYLRIFPSQTNKWFCYGMLSFTAVWAILSFFIALFQCRPVQSYWHAAAYPNRTCIDVAALYYTSGCLNIFSDFLVFLWPAKDLICVAGVCRIWYTSVFINSYDALWHGATLYVIVAIETSIGIVCGCLPSVKPLMSKILPQIFTSTHSSTHKKSSTKISGQPFSKVSGQPFPFQSLNGGITKEEAYSVEYHNTQKGGSERNISRVESRGNSRGELTEELDDDAISAHAKGSFEWIMMQENPNEVGSHDREVV